MIIVPLSSVGGVDKERSEAERLHLKRTPRSVASGSSFEVPGGFEPP